MSEIIVTRRGRIMYSRVMYKAGYEYSRHRIGNSPVYKEARVEQLSDGSVLYYPPTAIANTADGGCTLPADLLNEVVWDS